ncbi:MAG TPA: ornithine cyclodeaminase family protein [Pyrinomonadaceae bacterium]
MEQTLRFFTNRDVRSMLQLDECIDAVEKAFRCHVEGKSLGPGVLGIHAEDGGFHIKAAGLDLGRRYFVVKTNGNFVNNREKHGLPTIQGMLLLFDAANGTPLAVMDSIEITIRRTGAATGVAARHLARADARVMTVCGCGNQGEVSLRAVAKVRNIERVYAWDIDPSRAASFASGMSQELGRSVTAVDDLVTATLDSDIVATCTTASSPFLNRSMVKPGAFVAAVGADSDTKQELSSDLLAGSKVVVDNLAQCIEIGDLKLAINDKSMTASDVHAELGEVITGAFPGRESADEVIVFDSTGTALQDAAASAIVYERGIESNYGTSIELS